MKKFIPVCFLFFALQSCGQQSTDTSRKKVPPMDFRIYLLDSTKLEYRFWEVNRILGDSAERHSNGTNERIFYITDLLKSLQTTWAHQTIETKAHPYYVIDPRDTGKFLSILRQPQFDKALPGIDFRFGVPGQNIIPKPNQWMDVYPVLQDEFLQIDRANIKSGYAPFGGMLILEFDSTASKAVQAFTKKYKGRQMAVVINGYAYVAPIIHGEINQSTVQIEGGYFKAEAINRLFGTVVSSQPSK